MVTSIDGQMSVTHNDTSVSKNKGNGINTGSVKLYYNQQFGRGEYNGSGVTAVSSDLGYVFWAEGLYKNSSRNGAVYLIISRTPGEQETDKPKWIMSLVDENEVTNQDFKLACITGSSCVQIWQSDITYASGGPAAPECYFPFKIEVDQSTGEYRVHPGNINEYTAGPITGTCDGQVNFTAVATESNGSIASGTISAGPQPDTGPLKIQIGYISGNVNSGFQIYQMLTNSLYWEVFKCGTGQTEYYVNGV